LAKAIGKYTGPTLNISPVKFENFIRSWGAGLGYNYFFIGIDHWMKKAGILDDIPEPQKDFLHDTMGIRAFFTKPPTGYRAKSTNDFMEIYQDIVRADQGWKHYVKTKDIDKAASFLQENPEAIYARVARNLISDVGDIRKERDVIFQDRVLNPDQKRARLDELDSKIVDIARIGNAFMNEDMAKAIKLPPMRQGQEIKTYYEMIAGATNKAFAMAQKNPALMEDKKRLAQVIQQEINTWRPKEQRQKKSMSDLLLPRLELPKLPEL